MLEYAKRIDNMENTAAIIKELFGSMTDPEIISFGGGAPAKEALPVEIVREITNDIMTRDNRGVEALQYGPVPGIADLREAVAEYLLKPKGIEAKKENIIITSGGMEAINMLCQLYIEPGDIILVESPSFVHSFVVFDMFQAVCIPVNMDLNGMDIEDLEEKIKKYKPKMVYVIPTFQNPTGITLSQERRKKIAELGSKYDVIVLEDDPYRDIRYSGHDLLPIKAYDTTGHTILANSFSKIFSAGSRLGYIFAEEDQIKKLVDIKTATNSHTAMLTQIICSEFFNRGYYANHHKMICNLYRERRDVMLECIDKYFPEGTKRTTPDGGLFVWVELPDGINATELLKESVAGIKVAFVAGEGFFAERGGKGKNAMRISFGGVAPNKIKEGIERLGNLIKSKL